MMNNKGFSLIELIVVLSIIGVLAVALGTSFSGSLASNRIESQTKGLYADLMSARARAMQRNRIYFVNIAATNYQVIEDTDRDAILDAAPDDTPLFAVAKVFDDPISSTPVIVQMNTKGIITTPVTVVFNVTSSGTSAPDYDCIELLQTRIKMGRFNGGVCNVR
jgi:prepilin-type N-terminal cleavage/methylation domain-containing protein